MKPKLPALFLVAVSFTVAVGCSSGPSSGKPVSGQFEGSAESEKSTFYASAAGAPVFVKASFDARLLGNLEPHERVEKFGDAKGFAHVRARSGSMVGWVHNSQLVSRRPAQPSPHFNSPAPAPAPQPGDTTGTQPSR